MIIRAAVCGLFCLFAACSVPYSSAAHAASTDHDAVANRTAMANGNGDDDTQPATTFDPYRPATTRRGRGSSASAAASAGTSHVDTSHVGTSHVGTSHGGRLSDAMLADLEALAPQYSPGELFVKTHGEFMLKREAWRPDFQATLLGMSDVEVKHEPGDFDLRHARVDYEGKIFLPDPDAFFRIGLQYGQRTYNFSSPVPNGTHDEDLFRTSGTLGYGQFLDGDQGDLLLEVDFNPGMWSDFGGTTHRQDWQFYGRGLVTWRLDSGLYLKGGLERTGVFQNVDTYPLAGVSWSIDPQWRIDVLLPRQIRLAYDHDPSNSIFFAVELDGGEYRIRSPRPARTFRSVSVQEFDVSLGAQHRFDKHMSVTGRIGTLIGGDYQFQSNGPARFDGTLEPQVFAEVGFGWTF